MRAILTYHSVDASGSPISISPEVFQRHVRWLAEAPVAVVGLDRLLDVDPATDAVAITFDDGFRNFATVAWPLLRDHDLPVTLFVPAAKVGGTNDWDGPGPAVPNLPLLDWDDLGALVRDGVGVGSHTRTHADLRGLPHDRLTAEVHQAAELLRRRLGARPRSFAYPFGEWDAAARNAVADEYDLACTTRLAMLQASGTDPYLLPRLDAYYFREPGRLESWGTLTFRLYVRARRVARAARSLLGERRGPAPTRGATDLKTSRS